MQAYAESFLGVKQSPLSAILLGCTRMANSLQGNLFPLAREHRAWDLPLIEASVVLTEGARLPK